MCSGMNWCWNNVLHYITDTNNKHLLHLAPVELSVYQQINREQKKKVIYHEMKHERYIMKRGKIIKKSWTFTAQKKRRWKKLQIKHKKKVKLPWSNKSFPVKNNVFDLLFADNLAMLHGTIYIYMAGQVKLPKKSCFLIVFFYK